MYARIVSTGTLLILALALVACVSVVDSLPHGHSGCTAHTGIRWNNNVRFYLNHEDSRSCPLNAVLGATTSSGGIVKDVNAQYPTVYDASYLQVVVSDFATQFYDDEVFESCAITLGGPVTGFFYWTPPLPPPNQNQRDRIAEGFASYRVGDNPDFTCFEVGFNSTTERARARIDINYYGEQFRPNSSGP